jgi:hypothetical protein
VDLVVCLQRIQSMVSISMCGMLTCVVLVYLGGGVTEVSLMCIFLAWCCSWGVCIA